jgi:hypothetical protein
MELIGVEIADVQSDFSKNLIFRLLISMSRLMQLLQIR